MTHPTPRTPYKVCFSDRLYYNRYPYKITLAPDIVTPRTRETVAKERSIILKVVETCKQNLPVSEIKIAKRWESVTVFALSEEPINFLLKTYPDLVTSVYAPSSPSDIQNLHPSSEKILYRPTKFHNKYMFSVKLFPDLGEFNKWFRQYAAANHLQIGVDYGRLRAVLYLADDTHLVPILLQGGTTIASVTRIILPTNK